MLCRGENLMESLVVIEKHSSGSKTTLSPRTSARQDVKGQHLCQINQVPGEWLWHWNVEKKLGERQFKQKYYFDRKSGNEKSLLDAGQNCHLKTARGKWISGIVSSVNGVKSYDMDTPSGNTFRRNKVDIRRSLVVEPKGASPIPLVPMRTPEVQPTECRHRCDWGISGQGGKRTTNSGRRVRLPLRFADYKM